MGCEQRKQNLFCDVLLSRLCKYRIIQTLWNGSKYESHHWNYKKRESRSKRRVGSIHFRNRVSCYKKRESSYKRECFLRVFVSCISILAFHRNPVSRNKKRVSSYKPWAQPNHTLERQSLRRLLCAYLKWGAVGACLVHLDTAFYRDTRFSNSIFAFYHSIYQVWLLELVK